MQIIKTKQDLETFKDTILNMTKVQLESSDLLKEQALDFVYHLVVSNQKDAKLPFGRLHYNKQNEERVRVSLFRGEGRHESLKWLTQNFTDRSKGIIENKGIKVKNKLLNKEQLENLAKREMMLSSMPIFDDMKINKQDNMYATRGISSIVTLPSYINNDYAVYNKLLELTNNTTDPRLLEINEILNCFTSVSALNAKDLATRPSAHLLYTIVDNDNNVIDVTSDAKKALEIANQKEEYDISFNRIISQQHTRQHHNIYRRNANMPYRITNRLNFEYGEAYSKYGILSPICITLQTGYLDSVSNKSMDGQFGVLLKLTNELSKNTENSLKKITLRNESLYDLLSREEGGEYEAPQPKILIAMKNNEEIFQFYDITNFLKQSLDIDSITIKDIILAIKTKKISSEAELLGIKTINGSEYYTRLYDERQDSKYIPPKTFLSKLTKYFNSSRGINDNEIPGAMVLRSSVTGQQELLIPR